MHLNTFKTLPFVLLILLSCYTSHSKGTSTTDLEEINQTINSSLEYKSTTSDSTVDEYDDASQDSCKPNPCKNGGWCRNDTYQQGSFKCLCRYGLFTGNRCEIDPCKPSPCENGGSCKHNILEGFKCKCAYGYTGDKCEIDPCDPNPCENGGSCRFEPFAKSFQCKCPDGYAGDRCEMIDVCEGVRCEGNLTCKIRDGNATCECPDDYTGPNCEIDKCEDWQCQYKGMCFVINGTATCLCTVGTTGPHCETREDNVCDIGTCKNYWCNCCPGYTEVQDSNGLTICADPCEPNPCENGGSCQDDYLAGFKCKCAYGYTGDKCEIAPCDPNPCENGGSCRVKHSTQSFECKCPDGYTGDKCEIIDVCKGFKCERNLTCKIRDGNATCECPDDYTGSDCEIHKCEDWSCQNKGICLVVEGNATCFCVLGAKGPHCEEFVVKNCVIGSCKGKFLCNCCPGYTKVQDSSGLESHCIDPCDPNPCENGGTCIFKPFAESFQCKCPDGYTGDNCEIRDVCKDVICERNLTCKIRDGNATCECPDDDTGSDCQMHLCKDVVCERNLTCKIKEGNATCECPDEYTGSDCEIHKCEDWMCLNKGKCVVIDGKPECSCLLGASGRHCETLADENCVIGVCRRNHWCNCCPGYSVVRNSYGLEICTDRCEPNPCKNGGSCERTILGYFKCKCAYGYTGDKCEIEDPCFVNPCQNDGRCIISEGKATCICQKNFTGNFCEREDPCFVNPCQNDGLCRISEGKATCICQKNFTGNFCERVKNLKCDIGPCTRKRRCNCCPGYSVVQDIIGFKSCTEDPCYVNPCQNDGLCKFSKGKATCKCKNGFTGDFCEMAVEYLNYMCDRNCKETGGFCVIENNQTSQCICPEGTQYKWYSGCTRTPLNNTCPLYCEETGGLCISNGYGQTKCKCPINTTYIKYSGCHELPKNIIMLSIICVLLIILTVVVFCLLCNRIRSMRK